MERNEICSGAKDKPSIDAISLRSQGNPVRVVVHELLIYELVDEILSTALTVSIDLLEIDL